MKVYFINIVLTVFLITSLATAQNQLLQQNNSSNYDKVLIPKHGIYWMASIYLKNAVTYPVLDFGRYDSISSSQTEPYQRYQLFEACSIPVFCKIESIIEQKSKIPFRFRIGSLAEANRLEGK